MFDTKFPLPWRHAHLYFVRFFRETSGMWTLTLQPAVRWNATAARNTQPRAVNNLQSVATAHTVEARKGQICDTKGRDETNEDRGRLFSGGNGILTPRSLLRPVVQLTGEDDWYGGTWRPRSRRDCLTPLWVKYCLVPHGASHDLTMNFDFLSVRRSHAKLIVSKWTFPASLAQPIFKTLLQRY